MKADRCAQYVDDIGIAAHATDKPLQNIESVFQRIEIAGFKLSMSKCTFGQDRNKFLGKTINKHGKALAQKTDVFLPTLNSRLQWSHSKCI